MAGRGASTPTTERTDTMGITAEWGAARDTRITAVAGGCYAFDGQQVTTPAALQFDPQSGGGFVLEGNVHALAARLDDARRQLAPLLAADALADWDDYGKRHAAIMSEFGEQLADHFEDENLLDAASQLAAALRTLTT